MEKIKALIKKYPIIDFGIGIIIALLLPLVFSGEDSVFNKAMIQLNWCVSGDSICLLKHYFCISIDILLLCILIQFSWIGFKKLKPKIIKLKSSFQKERFANFFPNIYQNKNILYLRFSCPKNIILFTTVTYSLEYLKPKSKTTEPRTKSELYHDLARKALNPDYIKPSWWFKFSPIKIIKNSFVEIPLFEIDFKNRIFYLFRKAGKPKRFWNNENVPKLEEMSFGYGKHNFKITILAHDFFRRNLVQPFTFFINYSEKGLKIEKKKINLAK